MNEKWEDRARHCLFSYRQFRQLFFYRIGRGYSYAEASKRLGFPEQALNQHVLRLYGCLSERGGIEIFKMAILELYDPPKGEGANAGKRVSDSLYAEIEEEWMAPILKNLPRRYAQYLRKRGEIPKSKYDKGRATYDTHRRSVLRHLAVEGEASLFSADAVSVAKRWLGQGVSSKDAAAFLFYYGIVPETPGGTIDLSAVFPYFSRREVIENAFFRKFREDPESLPVLSSDEIATVLKRYYSKIYGEDCDERKLRKAASSTLHGRGSPFFRVAPRLYSHFGIVEERSKLCPEPALSSLRGIVKKMPQSPEEVERALKSDPQLARCTGGYPAILAAIIRGEPSGEDPEVSEWVMELLGLKGKKKTGERDGKK